MAPLVEIAEHPGIGEAYPGLTEAIAAVGDPQVRNRGTLGGNIAQDSAIGDAAAALLAIGATVTISGPGGDRSEPIDAVFTPTGGFQLNPAEIITFVELPANARGSAYEKFRNPASTYALCGVAALVRLAADGTVSQCRIAVTGATGTLRRLAVLEADVLGRPAASVTPGSGALQTQVESLVFSDDWMASADYRAHLTAVLAARSLQRAAARASQQAAG
jgi:carbon-monoxide dehydrogenase medium subunit